MTLHDGGPIGMKSFLMIGIHQVLETAWRFHHIDYPCLVVMNMVKYTSSFQSGLLFIRPFCFWTSFKHCSTHTTCYTVYLGRYFFKYSSMCIVPPVYHVPSPLIVLLTVRTKSHHTRLKSLKLVKSISKYFFERMVYL